MNGATMARQALLAWVSLVWLTGCDGFLNRGSEEKNPLIADARARKSGYDYAGAVASLEQAIESNPRLALAHWELGLLHYQNVNDYAAAIYHFEKLLKLRPDWNQADMARQFIQVCKLELAKTVPLGPHTAAIDKLTARLHELTAENDQLKGQLVNYQTNYTQLYNHYMQLRELVRASPSASTRPPASDTAPAPLSPPDRAGPLPDARAAGGGQLSGAAEAEPGPAAPGQFRSHAVARGETLASLGRRYGLPLRDLVNANADINPHRLSVGQVVRIPAR